MIVLKEGQLPIKEIQHKKTCRKCKAEFIYGKEDIVSVLIIEDYYDYIKCPTCGNKIKPSMFDKKVAVSFPDRIKDDE